MNRIQFISREAVTEFVPMQDAFEFHPASSGPFSWGLVRPLQRLAWWFLRKTGGLKQAHRQVSKVTTHVIDPPKFIDKLIQQRRSLMQDFHRTGQRLLIGTEDYADLMDEAQPGWFTFDADVHYRRSILGLKVEVVPWMRGVLLMP